MFLIINTTLTHLCKFNYESVYFDVFLLSMEVGVDIYIDPLLETGK